MFLGSLGGPVRFCEGSGLMWPSQLRDLSFGGGAGLWREGRLNVDQGIDYPDAPKLLTSSITRTKQMEVRATEAPFQLSGPGKRAET